VIAAVAVVALPVTALVAWALLRSPVARRIVAAPSRDRWHEQATPSFGGVAIFLGFAAGVGLAIAAGALPASTELFGILGGCTIVFLAGLLDDVYSLPPFVKLGTQMGAAALVLSTGLKVEIVSSPALAAFLGGLWLVGMTNAFNLLDNMDGLAATLAAVAASFFAIDAVTVHEERILLVLALAVALSCLGFLPFNFRPRKPAAVFMGDSGSQVLGFALGSIGLATSWKVAESTIATLLLPVLVLAVPILDTALVTVFRLIEGRPVYRGGRDHTSHRLVHYHGLSEKRTVVLLALIAAGLGLSSLAYSVLDDFRITLFGVLVSFVLLVQFAGFLADAGRGIAPEPFSGPAFLRPFVLQRRRLFEVLVDFALISASFSAAYVLGVNGAGTIAERHVFWVSLPAILAARFLAFLPAGLYRGVWRFAGARDAASVGIAVAVSEAVAAGVVAVTNGFNGFPGSVYVIDAVIATVLVGASRFAERGLFRALQSFKDRGSRRHIVIVGAGRGGRSLLRELRETPGEQVVGFVDDDPRLHNRRLQGVPVLGGLQDIVAALAETHPDVVLVTIPDAPAARLESLVRGCHDAGVQCRFVRRVTDLDPLFVLGTLTE
jgi:UDP-GlcNAc:undecaprenyl-phosphate/decaprenyl-phosphate GlcNAc-1-phosphate transferase